MKSHRKYTDSRFSSSSFWRWSSSPRSSFRSYGRVAAAARCSALALLFAAVPAVAQTIPAIRPLAPPPLPTTPLGRSLSGAYGAITQAGSVNPAGAQQANFAYVQALQRARMGDVSGALAAAHIAQALAASPAVAPQLLLPATPAPGPQPVAPARPGQNAGGVPSTAGVPIVENGVPLSPDLVVAKQEIDLAGQLSRHNLDGAKTHYRAALDAYVSGNAARARAEARAAFDAAADAISTVK